MKRRLLSLILLGLTSAAHAEPAPATDQKIVVTSAMVDKARAEVHGCVTSDKGCGTVGDDYAHLKARCGTKLAFSYDDTALKGALAHGLDFLAVGNSAFAGIGQLCQPADKASADIFKKQVKTVQFVWNNQCDGAPTSPGFKKNKCRIEGPTYEIKGDVLVVSLHRGLPDYAADLHDWLKSHL